MANARSRRRNPYRPGTPSYAQFQESVLRKRHALSTANVARAKKPEKRRRLKQQAAAENRALHKIETREEYRAKLTGAERSNFARLPIKVQDRLIKVERAYPHSVPPGYPRSVYRSSPRGALAPQLRDPRGHSTAPNSLALSYRGGANDGCGCRSAHR
jgi:hypothetical protein